MIFIIVFFCFFFYCWVGCRVRWGDLGFYFWGVWGFVFYVFIRLWLLYVLFTVILGTGVLRFIWVDIWVFVIFFLFLLFSSIGFLWWSGFRILFVWSRFFVFVALLVWGFREIGRTVVWSWVEFLLRFLWKYMYVYFYI